MHRQLLPGEKLRWYLDDTLRPAGAALAAVAAVWLVHESSPSRWTTAARASGLLGCGHGGNPVFPTEHARAGAKGIHRKTMSDIILSVCIPVYNCGKFLTEALESILSQAHDAIEVVVYDGGSTDDTAQASGLTRSDRTFATTAEVSAAESTRISPPASTMPGAIIVGCSAVMT